MATDLGRYPRFVSADTAQGLERAMRRQNFRDQAEYHFFDIQFVEPEGRWYAWFNRANENPMTEGEQNGNSRGRRS